MYPVGLLKMLAARDEPTEADVQRARLDVLAHFDGDEAEAVLVVLCEPLVLHRTLRAAGRRARRGRDDRRLPSVLAELSQQT